jgi:hypothetical protein
LFFLTSFFTLKKMKRWLQGVGCAGVFSRQGRLFPEKAQKGVFVPVRSVF